MPRRETPPGRHSLLQTDTVTMTDQNRSSRAFGLRFARVAGRIIAFTRITVYRGGVGSRRKVRLFTEQGPFADLDPREFTAAVMDGKIKRLDLPHSLYSWAERLSQRIGADHTPQQALSILQMKLQHHATTLNAEVKA